jgi:DNA-binding winged helix-turn-helix (wHTH) protein
MRYALGEVELDANGLALYRNAVLVNAEPRVLEFIFYLVAHRDRMVSKQELLERVWQSDAISESVLTRAACLARKLLANANAIRTVYGRGYQWMGQFDATMDDNDPADTSVTGRVAHKAAARKQ